MKRENKKGRYSHYQHRSWNYYSVSFWTQTKKITWTYSIVEKNSMKDSMKIVHFFLLCIVFFGSIWVFSLSAIDQTAPWQFNYEFNEALKYEWRVKIQPSSGLSLFDEARAKVQSVKNTKEGTKPTEMIHNMGNDFCRWFYGTCDETSIYARLTAWCDIARDTAMNKMQSDYIKNNTKLLLASYTSCQKLASDVIMAFKDSASIEIAGWKKEQIQKSQEKFTETSQKTFQEKVSNIWDVFKKKLTNFVRWVEGITRNVNLRW